MSVVWDGDVENEEGDEEDDCGMRSDGGCEYIGTEQCDACPYRDELDG